MIEILMALALAFSAAFPGVGLSDETLDPDGQPKVHDIMEHRGCDDEPTDEESFAWGGRLPCNR